MRCGGCVCVDDCGGNHGRCILAFNTGCFGVATPRVSCDARWGSACGCQLPVRVSMAASLLACTTEAVRRGVGASLGAPRECGVAEQRVNELPGLRRVLSAPPLLRLWTRWSAGAHQVSARARLPRERAFHAIGMLPLQQRRGLHVFSRGSVGVVGKRSVWRVVMCGLAHLATHDDVTRDVGLQVVLGATQTHLTCWLQSRARREGG